MQNKYEVIGVVGEGAYGIVYKCKNKETGKYVAIKKFKETEDELVKKTMKRELKMLQQLKHENIVEFQESFIHKNNLFLVFEFLEKNLLEVLEESPNGLSPKLIRSFIFQMCKAVSYLHKNNMIHRDVKPENLLIDEKMNLKLCDFGFARKIKLDKKNNNQDSMTDYVATRWYRAPEILLGSTRYGVQADMWSMGCIFGELLGGKPMFPGTSTLSQINKVLEVTGMPSREDIESINSELAPTMIENIVVKKTNSLKNLYPKASAEELDLLKKLLQFNPNKRINVYQALEHEYIKEFHDQFADTEIVCEKPIHIPIDDNVKYSAKDYRQKLYTEVLKRKKEIRKKMMLAKKNQSQKKQ